MSKALAVEGLSKSYGSVMAVNDLHFEVDQGEIFGILAHNGAGKSSSIECILGINIKQGNKTTFAHTCEHWYLFFAVD